jgi:hypothetical protein
MSFFSTSINDGPVPEPLSIGRVADVLAADSINVGYSDDKERLGGYFDDHLAEFLFYGEASEIMQVRVHWGRPLAAEHKATMVDLLNASNSSRIWPKCYVDEEEGSLYVMAEHAVDYEHGVTDAQLLLQVRTAITSALSTFGRLDEEFPEAVAAYREQNPDKQDDAEA